MTAVPMSGAGPSRTVLVIYSNDRSLPANLQIDEKLRETLQVTTRLDLNYQTEFLDYPHYGDEPDEAYDRLISDFFRAKYSAQPIDLIVTGVPEAYRFMRRHQNDLFPDIPILSMVAVSASDLNQTAPTRFLAIPISLDPNRPRLYHSRAEVDSFLASRAEGRSSKVRMTRCFTTHGTARHDAESSNSQQSALFSCCC